MTPQREEVLRLARRDRETFDLLLLLPKASLAALGFHAQQAAEKALEAVVVSLGLEVPRTHDLVALGQVILDSGMVLPLTVDQLRSLNSFAVEYRCDDELIPAISREALADTLAVMMDWVEKKTST